MSQPDTARAATKQEGVSSLRVADRDLALEDLLYLNRMTTVGQVLPSVAHELNNVLQVIGGVVEMLGMRDGLPGDVQEKMTRLGVQTRRASDMVRELVAFARHDDGGQRVVDVARSIDRALALRRYHLARAKVTVTVDTPQSGVALARLDGGHLQLVLLNLLINAEQSLAGRTDGILAVRVHRNGSDLEVSVADNGDGVPRHLANRVTEAFFTTKAPAAGLGLTVAAGLARAMGGRLEFRIPPEGGTVAVLSLPAQAEDRSSKSLD